MQKKHRLIIGISGASGITYGVRMLQVLQHSEIETHLVVSNAAKLTLQAELDKKLQDITALADVSYPIADIGAAIASGSFKTLGMVVAPCSIKTMSEIATGITSTLLSRAADVVLKERRKLVLMVRETPFHTGHLQTMLRLSEMGAIIAPPLPAFYPRPHHIDALIDHSVGRVLDLFDIDTELVNRWQGIKNHH